MAPRKRSIAAAVIALAACERAGGPPAPETTAAGPEVSYPSLLERVRNPDELAKAVDLGAFLPGLGPEAVPAVKSILEEAALLDLGAVEFDLLLRYWARHAPAEAGWYALSAAPRDYRRSAIFAAVSAWVAADPAGAVPQIRPYAREEGSDGQATQIALVRGWFGSGKPGLEEYIRDLGAGFERQRALAAFSAALGATRGSDALMRWAEAVPESDAIYKLEVFRSVGAALPPIDPKAAIRFCEARCDGPHGDSLRSRIAWSWVDIDPAATFAWLETSPRNEQTDFAVRTAYASWVRRDRGAALKWMGEHAQPDPTSWLQPALPVYARRLAEDLPLEGFAWAERIEREDDRRWTTLFIAHQWRERDQAAAEEWIRTSSLSEEDRIRVRTPGPGWRQGERR